MMTDSSINYGKNSRYSNLDVITKSTYKASVLPDKQVIDVSNPLAVHEWDASDTLMRLSYRYYGTTTLWWLIAYANKVLDPYTRIESGTLLYIPRRRDIPKELRE